MNTIYFIFCIYFIVAYMFFCLWVLVNIDKVAALTVAPEISGLIMGVIWFVWFVVSIIVLYDIIKSTPYA
jgi:hypothetical protein